MKEFSVIRTNNSHSDSSLAVAMVLSNGAVLFLQLQITVRSLNLLNSQIFFSRNSCRGNCTNRRDIPLTSAPCRSRMAALAQEGSAK